MSLSNILTFDQFVTQMATVQQAQASEILDFAPGSILLANTEANGNVGMWLQSLFLQALAVTRASTCVGPDLDSFVAQFNGPVRQPATYATGYVTFSRFSATQQAFIYPNMTNVQSADGTQNYTVSPDATNPLWDASQGAFVIPVNTTSITVPVTALTAGTSGNVTTGVISVITTPIPNVDTVSNSAPLINAVDEQKDAQYLVSFQAWIASLSKATKAAIAYAVTSLQQNLSCTLVENQQTDGTYRPGFFYGVINDGTGAPSSTVLANAAAAIEEARAFTIGYTTIGPSQSNVTVSMTVTVASGYDPTAVKAAVQTAIVNYINSLPLGAGLAYTMLDHLAYSASAGASNVTATLLNGGTSDIAGVSGTALATTTSAVLVS